MCRSDFPTRKSRENNTKNAKISKARKVAKYAKNYSRSKIQIHCVWVFPVILNACTLSRISQSFRDFQLFAFFAWISCSFRVGKSLLHMKWINNPKKAQGLNPANFHQFFHIQTSFKMPCQIVIRISLFRNRFIRQTANLCKIRHQSIHC